MLSKIREPNLTLAETNISNNETPVISNSELNLGLIRFSRSSDLMRTTDKNVDDKHNAKIDREKFQKASNRLCEVCF